MAKKKVITFNSFEPLSDTNSNFVEPGGNNSLSSLNIFQERKYYSDVIYSIFDPGVKPIDFWDQKNKFGKINFQGDSCFASKDGLKQITTNVWTLDFVADAFAEFKEQFLFLNKNQVEGTPFELLTPSRGWSSAIDLYDGYMDQIYDLFLTYLNGENLNDKINNFEDFMDHLYDFINNSSPNISFTLSNFINSNKCPSTISGLIIDISTDKHDNDTDKYNHFLSDQSYECFCTTAERFGFKVDKNFPGRLVADIKSPVMNRDGDPNVPAWQGGQGYMLRYPKEPKPFTEKEPIQPQLRVIEPIKDEPEIPFDIGDKVSIASVRSGTGVINGPNRDPFTYYMLKNYTEIENRFKEAGYRPKRVDGKNVFFFVRDRVTDEKPNATFIPIYGEVSAINPSAVEGELYFGPGYVPPNYDTIIVKISAQDGVLGRSPANIWSEETLLSAEANELADSIIYSSRSQEYRHNFSNLNNTVQTSTYIQVPLDSVHLKEGTDNNPFVYEKFSTKVNFSKKKQNYDSLVRESQLEYERAMILWQNARNEYMERKQVYDSRLDFYNNSSRMSTLNLFQRRYNTAYLFDLNILREICLQFYYSYVKINPESRTTEFVNCSGQYVTKQKKNQKEFLNKSLFEEKYSLTYWIQQYILILNAESENKKNIKELRKIKTRAIQIYNLNGINKTLKYLSDVMIKK